VTLARLRRLTQVAFLAIFLIWPAVLLRSDPLLGVLNGIASHTLARDMLWGLFILIPTFFLGRFYCGWICPLGTLNHLVSRARRGLDRHRYRPWQRLKYYVLGVALAAALFGSTVGALLDPISLLVRSVDLSLRPIAHYAGLPALHPPHYAQGWFIGLLFIVILLSSLLVTRFWCRALCPLGALLGVASRWSIVVLRKPKEICGQCNLCLMDCQGGDEPLPGKVWRKAECHLCMNCVVDCPDAALHFSISSRPPMTLEQPDLGRRAALASLAGGAVTVPLLRAGVATPPRPIRPPGARDEASFLSRCVRCGECMKVCPNNALHPALAEAGAEGLWTPVLIPRAGYCEPSCVQCGVTCPTEAIRRFTVEEKGWVTGKKDAPIRIGMAFVDRGRCLPWAMETECIVCEEWCPTSPKAIHLQTANNLRQPVVDPNLCVGCGACEYACPIKERPAIYVTAATTFLIGRPQGWTRLGATRTYDASNLWEYLDGGADKYVQAGVLRVASTHYRYQNRIEAVVDVYTLRSADAARSLFDSEPAAGARPVSIGEAGRAYSASLTFRDGPRFVRITAYEEGADLVALARTLARRE